MSTEAKHSYNDLAKEAIAALKERTGTSLQAIKAYIASKHPGFSIKDFLLLLIYEYEVWEVFLEKQSMSYELWGNKKN